jgi:hypothetical protein
MGKYKIQGFPNQEVPKVTLSKVLGPVNRKIANVEAEKGETVVTNMSRGLNNIYEMYSIGGKKHSQGGTPLNLPTDGDKESDGTSFIFSDNKKMIVKDPALLEYFGVNPKKPQTFAGISKSWLSAINTSKQILIDDTADRVSKKSAQMSMDNAAFKISALKLLQESKKGMKDGVPNGLSPFFDKLQLDPNEIFAMNEQDAEATNQAVAKAFGGAIKDFTATNEQYPFPSLAMGGELPKFEKKGEVSETAIANAEKKDEPKKDELNWGTVNTTSKKQYNYIVNNLSTNDKFKTALYQEYLKAAQQKDNFGKGYNYQFDKDPKNKEKIIRKTPNEVFQDYLEFQKRNLILQSHGKDVLNTEQNPIKGQVSNKDITKWSKELGVPLPSIDKATQEQLSYIAFENLSKNRNVYDEELKSVMKPFGATQHGKSDEKIAGSKDWGTISKADGAYTNTTAGQISYFTEPAGPCPACPDGTVPERQLDGTCPCAPAVDKPCPTCPDGSTPAKNADGSCPPCEVDSPDYKKLGQTNTLVNPYGFRREDLASLNRAVQARFEIPKIKPWAKSAQVVMPDRTYYSPERSIAAKNEQLNQAMQSVRAFGNAQSAGATAMALSGQAYADVANTISDYADKNVGIFNSGEQYNTQLANARNAQDAQLATSLYDKESTLKQSLANSISAAKDKITQLSNQAYTNASNIYNLNSTNENFKKDPFTGIITKMNDRAITPVKDNSQDFGQEFNAFAKSMPSVSGDLQMKAFLAMKSGKYVMEPDDQVTKASELNNTSVAVKFLFNGLLFG